MPNKFVKTAKLYLASVMLCTPYATPKEAVFLSYEIPNFGGL